MTQQPGEFKSCNMRAVDGSKISYKLMGEVAAAAIQARKLESEKEF